jgi:hypothetical protein
MKRWHWSVSALGLLLLFPWLTQAQEKSSWSAGDPGKPASLAEVVAAVNLPAEWGTLRAVLPQTGDPPYYPLFFEDAGGNIRIVPLYLNLVSGSWYLSVKRDPVAVIRRGPQ